MFDKDEHLSGFFKHVDTVGFWDRRHNQRFGDRFSSCLADATGSEKCLSRKNRHQISEELGAARGRT